MMRAVVRRAVLPAAAQAAQALGRQPQQTGRKAQRGLARPLAALAVAAAAAGATSWSEKRQEQPKQQPAEPKQQEEQASGYRGSPIQNVTALLQLYDEIDKNMAVLAGRMLEQLERKLEAEKRDAAAVKLSPEQRALNMSIEFEATLEKVQDAVFRNHYVSKQQVQEALERLARGELRGGGKAGAVSVAEAEAIAEYVRKLGRMRWLCTGSREPLIPTESARMVPDEKPQMDVDTVVAVMTELIPALTSEMEALVKQLRARKPPLAEAEFHRELSRQYIARSGELTARVCGVRRLDVREFQQALLFYHDDAAFSQALALLSAAQQQKFRELGLY